MFLLKFKRKISNILFISLMVVFFYNQNLHIRLQKEYWRIFEINIVVKFNNLVDLVALILNLYDFTISKPNADYKFD